MMQGRSALWIGDSVCVTNLTAQRLGVPPERLMMWPIFEADEAAAQASPWREGDTLKIGSLGRLHPVKGYDVLVAALALLKGKDFHPPVPFQLVIAGEGDERPRLEAAARKAGLDIVHFPGFADQPRNFLAGLHLYVQPSRSEGLCIAAHEAMQAGLPIVASAVGEMPYSIEEGVTGLVVPPADPVALAAALLSLLNDPKRLAHMGHAARVRVLDRFGTAAFAEAGRRVMQRLRTLR
jgi:glycosyltransferase involved in cell wall biosynthesis